MTFNMTVEHFGIGFFQERHAGNPVIGANIYIQQHTSSDNVNNFRMRDAFREVNQKDSTLSVFFELWPLDPSLRIIVSTSSIVKNIRRTILHICNVVIQVRDVAQRIIPRSGIAIWGIKVGISSVRIILTRTDLSCRCRLLF